MNPARTAPPGMAAAAGGSVRTVAGGAVLRSVGTG